MADPASRPAFARAAVPLAVVTLAVLAGQLAYELSVPEHGPERDADRDTALPLALRWGGAALVSVLSGLLPLAARRDRDAVAASDDRLVGSYWAFGLVLVVLAAATGAAPAMLVATGTLVALSAWRATAGPSDLARAAQALAFAVVAVHVLALGVRFLLGTYLRWQLGFAPPAEVAQARADWHAGTVQDLAVLLAFLTTLLLPVLLWRHREAVPAARGPLTWACLGIAIVSFAALDHLGAIVGLACLVAVRLARPAEPASSGRAAGPRPEPAVALAGGAPDPLFWLPGPAAGEAVDDWLPRATSYAGGSGARGRRSPGPDAVAARLRAAVAPDPEHPDLPGRLLHWRDPRREPLVARFGVVPLARAEELVAQGVPASGPRPPVTRLAGPGDTSGSSARRWVVRTRAGGRDVLELRYLAPAGRDRAVVLVLSDNGTGLFHLQDSLDAFVTGLSTEVPR